MSKIDVLLLKFESPYIGNPYYIPGNSIYHAVARDLSDAQRKSMSVSHGIFLNIQDGARRRGEFAGKSRGKSPVSKIESYEDFFELRTRSFLKPESDYLNIIHRQKLMLSSGRDLYILHPRYLTFYVENFHGDVEAFDGLQLGAKRNFGFGMTALVDNMSIDLDELDCSAFNGDARLISTAKQGIGRIHNHAKYGYGEFMLVRWREGWLVKLITPLCMHSTACNTASYRRLPTFLSGNGHRTRVEEIRMHGRVERLYLVDHRQVFEYVHG